MSGAPLRDHATAQAVARPGSPTPAVLFSPAASASLEIAGLTLLDRLVVTVHRAGAAPIFIVPDGAVPRLDRTRALGIEVQVCTQPPVVPAPVLLASAEVLVQVQDVCRCLQSGTGLTSRDGQLLPLGVASAADARVQPFMESTPQLQAEGVACLVQNQVQAKAAEAELWKSLTSRSDGLVDKVFNRPCGRPLSKWLVRTTVSPNAVSILSILIGLAAAYCFAQGQWTLGILAGLLFQLSAIIDCVDGDLARVMFKESRFGKWLDLGGDQLVHVSVFAGIAAGLARFGAASEALWLGISAVAGALISFAVVVRGMRHRPGENQRLQRLIDSATNRDFSVLVLILACWDQLGLFLWLAAIGSHLFWIVALALQTARPSSRRPGP